MDHTSKNTYLFSIDALRVIAIISVIAIHISIKILATLEHNIDSGVVSFIFNQTTRFAVPLFFLISGFVLELNYKEKLSYLNFFKKRASRVILPFTFWSLFYIMLSSGFEFLNKLNYDFFYNFINGNSSYHLYFIPTLIIFYLSFPLFHKGIVILKKPAIILSLLIVQFYLLYSDYYIETMQMNQVLRIALLSFPIFVFGMILSHYKNLILKTVKKFKYPVSIFFVILFLLVPLHVYDLTIQNSTTKYIYDQYHPLNYIYTVTLFVLFFYVFEKTQILKKQFIYLSKLSFFVFFIHVFIQTLVWENIIKVLINKFGTGFLTTFWFTPLIFIVLTFISFFIAFIVHKIPKVYKITG